MILCVGTLGCGKSALLKSIQGVLEKNSEKSSNGNNPNLKTISKVPNTIPTVGTNLVELVREKKKKNVTLPPDVVVIREVGGAMTPLLHSFIEPGKTKAILYVIDSSSPETLGAATIYLVELMAQPGLESSQVMIVFTKTDMTSARSLNEIKAIMRFDHISSTSKQNIQQVNFNAETKENAKDIAEWCLKFSSPQQPKNQMQY